jgi:hypothetical protein
MRWAAMRNNMKQSVEVKVKQLNKVLILIVFCLATSSACTSTIFPSPTATATPTPMPTSTLPPTSIPEIEPTPTDEISFDSISYSTGIEIIQILEVPAVIDRNGNYAMTFPPNWKLGPLHTDFASIIEEESQVNENVKGLFEYFLISDPNIRAFGFSTSAAQLNKDSFLIAVVKMFKGDDYLSRSIDELADLFIANQPSQELVNFTYRSESLTSPFDVSTLIMLNEVQDGKGNIAIYNGILLAKLDSAYVQVFFLTNNPEINLGEELAYPASSIMNYDE